MPNIDKVSSYNTGLTWEPVEGYILRANYARAQRAPDIIELLSPRRGDYDSYDDICDNATVDSDELGHDNCRLDPLVAAEIAAEGSFDDDNNGYSPAAGNENLIEETADTITVGFSIAPSWLEGFRLAVDYWDISIDDAISSVGNGEIMKQCYASSIPFGQPNPWCDDLTRDDEGILVEILQRDLNLNELSASGIDLALDYVFETDSFGELQFVVNWTHYNDYTSTFQGVDGPETVDFNNQVEHKIFEDVATGSLAWRYNDWRVRWRTTWKGPVVDHNSRVVSYREDVADNDALCAAADPDCITNPEKPKYLWYGSYVRHDLSASYDMTLDTGATLNVYGGVRNMFDKDPFVPRTGDNIEHGIGNYDSFFGGGIGRFFYAGAAMRFE